MLTPLQCTSARPKERDYKLADGHGLYLFVSKSGGKSWRMKFRFAGKEGLLTFGPYPLVSLKDARAQRDEARKLIRDGINPAVAKRKRAHAIVEDSRKTVEVAGRMWHETQLARWSARHADDVLRSLERDIFPSLGSIPVSQLDETLILSALRKIENRGAIETAHRARQRLEAVLDFAKGAGMPNNNPAIAVKKSLKPMPANSKQPAIVTFNGVRDLLAAVESQPAHPVSKLAHRFLALTCVRPGVIRMTEWAAEEFEDLEGVNPVWRIPAARMKLGVEHKGDETFDFVVPLSPQAVDVINATRRLTGNARYMFPSTRSGYRPMSENTINFLLHRSGYRGRQVGHGWRASFSTIMNERAERSGTHEADTHIIDLMLAHAPRIKWRRLTIAQNTSPDAVRFPAIGQR